jgi:hypothetical protein
METFICVRNKVKKQQHLGDFRDGIIEGNYLEAHR